MRSTTTTTTTTTMPRLSLAKLVVAFLTRNAPMPWYPEMRQRLVRTAAILADPEYQQRVWIRHEMPPGIAVDSLDQAVHFVYDDTCLGENPSEAIGWYLHNEDEASAVRCLVVALDSMFDALGTQASDAQYLGSEQWPTVVSEAKSLCDVLEKNREPG